MAFFLHPSAVAGLFPSFTISAQLHVGFGSVYFLYTIKKLWVLHVLLLCHISRPILVLLLVLKLPSTIVCEVAPQMYEHINTTTSIQHAQAHFAIQFCFIHFFRLSRDFYFMKCFDSTIFKLSWSKCIKCNVALFSIIVFFFLFIVDVMLRLHPLAHSLQLDQKCINFIFIMAGWQRAVNTTKKNVRRLHSSLTWTSMHRYRWMLFDQHKTLSFIENLWRKNVFHKMNFISINWLHFIDVKLRFVLQLDGGDWLECEWNFLQD